MNLDATLENELAELSRANLRRALCVQETAQGARVVVDDGKLLNFSSNDYLGLAAHPQLREAAMRAIEKYGCGAGASRLVCGNLRIHHELDEALAQFKGAEAALAFSSGYAAALGAVPALVGRGDTVILDKLCHACLIDGARLSGATVRVFPHNHVKYLEKLLRKISRRGRILIVTESVFSMDGDRAPLPEIVRLKNRYGAWLLVDEAHAAGIFGKDRRGLIEEVGLDGQVELQMGTLSKALGSGGGYIAGSRVLIDFLVNRARSFIYSTAPPPAAAAAALAGIQLVQSKTGHELQQKLWSHIETLGSSLKPRVKDFESVIPLPLQSPIVPVILGAESRALEAAQQLRKAGLLVPAIRYPTVGRGKARLRISLSAAHKRKDILFLAAQIQSLLLSGNVQLSTAL